MLQDLQSEKFLLSIWKNRGVYRSSQCSYWGESTQTVDCICVWLELGEMYKWYAITSDLSGEV